MRRRLFTYALTVLAASLLLACASRNDVCETCIERTDERLMDAAAELYPGAVNRLLDEGADINAKDQYGETPLMKALRQPASRSLESMRPMEITVRELLDAGADFRVVNTRGVDTLKLVQETGNLEVIKLFDSRITPEERDLMFMRTLADGQYVLSLYLLQSGANPTQVNDKNQSALHLAVNSAQPSSELVSALLKTNDVNRMDNYGTTPVMTACANGAPVGIVASLLENGSKINSRYQEKNLLYLALTAEKENTDLVKYLLKNGFSANETAPGGQPFIVLMAKADRIQSARALANAGADISVLDKYGESAYRSRLNILPL